jgi:cyclophilin family peptidyl-prolyl cis-trans isomerase
MKKLFTLFYIAAAAACMSLPAAAADRYAGDVALVTVKIEHDDHLLPVIIEFYDSDAPRTVANFERLARKGFYNDIAFHRVVLHTLIQAGDPLSKNKKDRSRVGTGGPGYTLPPEIHRKHIAGAVAMSRLGDTLNPGRVSSGSQFYICLKAQPSLDGQYTVFGQVTRGMENVDKISALAADNNNNPFDRAEIKSIRILPADVAERDYERELTAKPSKFLQFLKSIQL